MITPVVFELIAVLYLILKWPYYSETSVYVVQSTIELDEILDRLPENTEDYSKSRFYIALKCKFLEVFLVLHASVVYYMINFVKM